MHSFSESTIACVVAWENSSDVGAKKVYLPCGSLTSVRQENMNAFYQNFDLS